MAEAVIKFEIIAAAKAKALQTLDDPEPKLTKLELAFVTSLTNKSLGACFHTRYHLSTPPYIDDHMKKQPELNLVKAEGPPPAPPTALKWSKSGDLSHTIC